LGEPRSVGIGRGGKEGPTKRVERTFREGRKRERLEETILTRTHHMGKRIQFKNLLEGKRGVGGSARIKHEGGPLGFHQGKDQWDESLQEKRKTA